MISYNPVGYYPVGTFIHPQNVIIDPYNVPVQAYPGTPNRQYGTHMTVQEYESLLSDFRQLEAGKCELPDWLYDENGNFTVSMSDLFTHELFYACLKDKRGSRFIQDNFPNVGSELRHQMFEAILQDPAFFDIATDRFGNFVLQKIIEEVDGDFRKQTIDLVALRGVELSFDRFACRVVQKVLDIFTPTELAPVLKSLQGSIVPMALDQSANHVLQRIVKLFPNKDLAFLGAELALAMDDVICNKFGCRVVQYLLEKLCSSLSAPYVDTDKKDVLRIMLDKIVSRPRYCQDEYANYVVQYILGHCFLTSYADKIVEKSIRRNFIQFSTDKFASHVIEKALEVIDPATLDDIVHDLFMKHCGRNGRLAIEKMLFDQFGNYVVQRLLAIAIEIRHGRRKGTGSWFDPLSKKIIVNASALLRYSSGKKIIEVLSHELGTTIE